MTADPEERGGARHAARPGRRDVAKLAGVSHQTVSRVFRDHPRASTETARECHRGRRDALTGAGAPVPPATPGDWSAAISTEPVSRNSAA
jgi:Bacterial regulatory proteins, lacI family